MDDERARERVLRICMPFGRQAGEHKAASEESGSLKIDMDEINLSARKAIDSPTPCRGTLRFRESIGWSHGYGDTFARKRRDN